jgi:hypothetical protein
MYKPCCLESLYLTKIVLAKNDKCSENLLYLQSVALLNVAFLPQLRLFYLNYGFSDECFPNYSKMEQPIEKGRVL